uniref:Endo/exonuclease/phosphatase domain-containing protein n=1 Tax=Haemonchus contortus TaxID=6289 RepID=A0A7I5EAI4_HAECO
MDLERLYRETTFFKVIYGDFNAKIGSRRTAEELHIGIHEMEWNEQGERLSEVIASTHTIHDQDDFPSSFCGTVKAFRRAMEKVVYDFYSDLFDSHVYMPTCHLRQNGYLQFSLPKFDMPSRRRGMVQHPVPTGSKQNI